MSRWNARHWAAGLGATIGAVGAYALWIEPNLIQVTRPRVHVRGLPHALEGFRIGLLSDLHVGRLTPASRIRRAVQELMDAKPHIIAITGDVVDRRHQDFEPAFAALHHLWAPHGVWAVPGNHDHAAGIEGWSRGVAASPTIGDLTNRYVIVQVAGVRLCLAGVDDLDEGAPQLRLPPVMERDVTVLLAHQPDHAERARRVIDEVDLVLAGHTHGGQLRVPGLGPLERKSEIYDEGLRRRPWTQVYTSRGVGTTLLPMRFGARPEVAVIELTGEARERWEAPA